MTFDRVMHTMSQDPTTITAAHEKTCSKMPIDPGMNGRLVHHRDVEIIVTTCAVHYGRVQRLAKKEAAIVATVRAINTTIDAIEDRKSDSDEYHVKATAVTSAKPHAISRLCWESRSLAKA